MDLAPDTVGVIGLIALLLLIFARFPVPLALMMVSIGGLFELLGFHATFSLLGSVPYEFAASWELSAVPMFLLMGALAYHSGMTSDLYGVARLWLRNLPGGLAVASNFACAGFAAASGSSVATTVAMGRIAVPEMLKSGYDKGLATGVVATAGTLGSLIPPSVLMIVYGIFTQQSIGDLFLAGVVPGLLTAAIYAVMIVVRCRLNPALAPSTAAAAPLREKMAALLGIWPLPILIVGVIGSIYGGIATPTEAGAVGAMLAAAIAAGRGTLTRAVVRASVVEAMQATATIFFVSIGAVLLTRFIVFSGLPNLLTGMIDGGTFNLFTLLMVTTLVFLILGTFLEPIGLVLIAVPIFLPAFRAFDVNLIWFGILVVKYVEIGLITPPVGLNVFALKSVVGDSVSLETIFRGVIWFFLCEVAVVAILIAFPDISLFLPGLHWSPKLF
jgi:tripartite ATP-independent transporter DctM subunit